MCPDNCRQSHLPKRLILFPPLLGSNRHVGPCPLRNYTEKVGGKDFCYRECTYETSPIRYTSSANLPILTLCDRTLTSPWGSGERRAGTRHVLYEVELRALW